MQITSLITALETIAPAWLAEPWDNVGLLLGDPEQPLAGPVIFTIDCTQAVVTEACDIGASAIVSYHPPIFGPINRIAGPDARSLALLQAARAGIAIYSSHTALDASPNGVTDWLCNTLSPGDQADTSFGDRRAIEPFPERTSTQECKIVTFVPADDVDRLRDALASAGAGRIGQYELVSFRSEGLGMFRPTGSAKPHVGTVGELQHVPEARLEMVCSKSALPLAGELLKQFHPYEEPAWEIHELLPKPNRSVGAGRVLTLDQSATPTELAQRLKSALAVDAVKLASVSDEPVNRIGVCPGAGGSLLESALDANCTLFVTGEMRHHEVLRANEQGCSILLAGHTNTERGFLPHYASKLSAILPGIKTVVSSVDKSLFRTL